MRMRTFLVVVATSACFNALAAPVADMLDRRAPTRVEATGIEVVLDDNQQPENIIEHPDAGAGDILQALRNAYGEVPLCVEAARPDRSRRLHFTILANMRLEDALNMLEKDSEGYFSWKWRAERLIVQFAGTGTFPDAPDLLGRPFHADIHAETLGDAMAAIEATYNAAFQDVPVLVENNCTNWPPDTPLSPALRIAGETSLREALLELLQTLGDIGTRYISGFVPRSGEWYVRTLLMLKDCTDQFETPEQYERFLNRLEERREILDAFFDRGTETGDEP